jgi:hypothetical protein
MEKEIKTDVVRSAPPETLGAHNYPEKVVYAKEPSPTVPHLLVHFHSQSVHSVQLDLEAMTRIVGVDWYRRLASHFESRMRDPGFSEKVV